MEKVKTYANTSPISLIALLFLVVTICFMSEAYGSPDKPQPVKKVKTVAQKWHSRVYKIKEPAYLMRRCGEHVVNGQSRLNKIHKNKSSQDRNLLKCLEKEQVKYKLEVQGQRHNEEQYLKVLKAFKKYNCPKLSDSFNVLVCKILQKRI